MTQNYPTENKLYTVTLLILNYCSFLTGPQDLKLIRPKLPGSLFYKTNYRISVLDEIGYFWWPTECTKFLSNNTHSFSHLNCCPLQAVKESRCTCMLMFHVAFNMCCSLLLDEMDFNLQVLKSVPYKMLLKMYQLATLHCDLKMGQGQWFLNLTDILRDISSVILLWSLIKLRCHKVLFHTKCYAVTW